MGTMPGLLRSKSGGSSAEDVDSEVELGHEVEEEGHMGDPDVGHKQEEEGEEGEDGALTDVPDLTSDDEPSSEDEEPDVNPLPFLGRLIQQLQQPAQQQQHRQRRPAAQEAQRAQQRQPVVTKSGAKTGPKSDAAKPAGGSDDEMPGLVSEDADSGSEASSDDICHAAPQARPEFQRSRAHPDVHTAYLLPVPDSSVTGSALQLPAAALKLQGRRQQQPPFGQLGSYSTDEESDEGAELSGAARRGHAAQQQRQAGYTGLAAGLAPLPLHLLPCDAVNPQVAPVLCQVICTACACSHAGAGRREDLRGSAGAAGRGAAAQPPPASQFAEAQARQRRPRPPPAPVAVEQIEAQVAEDEALKAALKLEEEERKALRKKLGLEEDEETEVEDTVLGTCTYGKLCSRDPEEHLVKSSHTDRYEFRCSAGHRMLYHQPCWRKATVRMVDAKGGEHTVVGKDYKWPKKTERKKCIDPSCDGIITFIEGPSRYSILNIEDEVKAEMGGSEAKEEEVPEWQRYKREQELDRKERRYRFKKGRGRRDEEEEEPAATPTAGKAARAQEDQQPAQQSAPQEDEPLDSSAPPAAAAAEEQADEPAAATPALPDDSLLQAYKRDSSDEELLAVGLARRARDRGKGPAREAEIVYEDSKPDKRKKKGIKLVVGGLSMAEQRELQRQQDLGVNVLDFPDLEEAHLLAKERARGEDADRLVRDRQSAATLSALRSFKAGEFRPDDPTGPSTVLVENIDFRRIRDEDSARPEMHLRSTFAEYGPVKDLCLYEPCKAALVSFRSTAAAYKAFVLLSQKVLLHSRLTTMMLKRMPKEEGKWLGWVERREAQGDAAAFAFEEDDWAAGPLGSAAADFGNPPAYPAPSRGNRAPLYADTPAALQARSVSTWTAARDLAGPSGSITIPGAAAAAGVSGSAGPGSAMGSFGTPNSCGLRVGAAEFRPGSSGATTGTLTTQQAQQAQRGPPADPLALLASKFLSAQLLAASQETYQAYLEFGDQNFGLPLSQLDRPGVVLPDQVALLMVDQAAGLMYGVWSMVNKESLEGYGEVAAFKREHIMHPLPLDRVDGLLLKLGTAVKLPQKVPAATVAAIMRAFAEHERERGLVQQAEQAATAALAGLQPPAPPPQPEQEPQAAQQAAQQEQQEQQPAPADEWWVEEERRRREQEEKDAEIARQLQEQLLAEARLEEQRRLEEDRRLAAALRASEPAPPPAPPPGVPAGYAAVAVAPPAAPPRAPAPFRPPGIFSSLFPGQRPPGGGAGAPAPPAALAASAVPAPHAAASSGLAGTPPPGPARPAYRPPAGYRPPGLMTSAAAAAITAAPAASASLEAPPAPAITAPAPPTEPIDPAAVLVPAPPPEALPAPSPATIVAPHAEPPPPPGDVAEAVAPAPAAPVPPQLKHPCVRCEQRESVHIWIPCGHRGHCEECLPDHVTLDDKLAQFPKCLVCSAAATYYIRMFS
ncbi:hypothetical protein ABPG77_000053 [Micractinium sp. CCAP 211/92]